jgi:hypothetical protein
MRPARLAEEIQRVGQAVDHRLILGHLAVEDAEGVGDGAALAVRTQRPEILAERLDQRLAEGGTARGASDRVDDELGVLDAEFGHERPREIEDLGIDGGVGHAEHLDVELVELAVASLLRPLVPEHRPEQVDLGNRHRLLEAVLDEGPDQAGRGLRPKRDAFTALVGEGVHLLLDDVRGFAGALGEQFLALDDGRPHLGVPVALEQAARDGFDPLPALDLAGQDVVGASNSWNHDVMSSLRPPVNA